MMLVAQPEVAPMPSKRKSRKTTAEFSADRPIASAKADRLGRKAFAEGLAKRIQSWNGRDSLVIALCGEWGCGKTSLKNMVIEKLRRGASPKVDLLEFNPWEISGRDSLASTFFRELTLVLAAGESAEPSTKNTIRRLQLYAKVASFGGTALKAFGTVLGMTGIPFGPAFSAAGDAASQSAEVASQGAEAQEASDGQEQSLTELKRSLTHGMAELKRPVLIVIDDIDRLTTDEIREIFQLVKANADFPNLIYLLMFDREIVAGALDTISGNRGHEFLDKIVQVLFHVPQPSIKSVHGMLFEGLNAHLADVGVGERWENSRWYRVWHGGLPGYFTNLRCVYRFLGSFGFQVSQMRAGAAFELNPLDLVVLETLRLFEPALYEALPASRNILVDDIHAGGFLNEADKKKRAATEIERLLSFASQDRREGLREILAELFPVLFGHHFDHESCIRQLRVGHKDIFDRYFTMSLASDDVSQADLDSLLANFTDSVEFARICASLQERGQLETAFQRLDAYKQELPKAVFPRLITTLIDVGDSLPEKARADFFTFDALAHAYRLIYFGLRMIEDEGERFNYLKTGIAESKGVRLAVKLVASEERRSDSSPRNNLVSEEQWAELKPLALERIRAAAGDGRLRKMCGAISVLWRWQEWAGTEEAKDWITSELRTGDDALWVLKTFLSTMRQESTKVIFVRYISLNTLERFTDIETLSKLTEPLELAALEKDNMRALRAFRQARLWKAEGKPDDYNGDTWRGKNPLAEED